jgi:hypothetical protein
MSEIVGMVQLAKLRGDDESVNLSWTFDPDAMTLTIGKDETVDLRKLLHDNAALGNVKTYQVRPSGLKWKRVGVVRPTKGRELTHASLAYILAHARDPSRGEWESFQITDLHHDDYIMSGSCYFQPTDGQSVALSTHKGKFCGVSRNHDGYSFTVDKAPYHETTVTEAAYRRAMLLNEQSKKRKRTSEPSPADDEVEFVYERTRTERDEIGRANAVQLD